MSVFFAYQCHLVKRIVKEWKDGDRGDSYLFVSARPIKEDQYYSLYNALKLFKCLQMNVQLTILFFKCANVYLTHNSFPMNPPFQISHNNPIVSRIRVRTVGLFGIFQCTQNKTETPSHTWHIYLRDAMFHSLFSCLCPRRQIKAEETGWIDVHPQQSWSNGCFAHTRSDQMSK